MYLSAKTILTVYGKLSRHAEKLEDLIRNAAIRSFGDITPCDVQAERICLLIEKKNALINLKVKARKAMRCLRQEEIEILAHRFCNKGNLYYSKSSYFRRLRSALKSYTEALILQGITDDIFKTDYADKIAFIGSAMDLCLADENAINARKMGLKLNKSFSKGALAMRRTTNETIYSSSSLSS